MARPVPGLAIAGALRYHWPAGRRTAGVVREAFVQAYFSVALIIISLVLIGLVMLQARGGGLGSVFGGDGGVYKTRRGMEKTVFNTTIVFAVAFLLISLFTVLSGSR